MPRYHRILVRFRIPLPSENWSELHWCELQQTDEGIKTYVAPINQSGMPKEEAFKILDAEQARKLLVIDFPSAPKPRQPGAPLLARREEGIDKYCLVIHNKKMYKFNFAMHTNLLMKVGQIWKADREFDNSKETINTIFNINEIARDSRLQMRTSESYNYNLLDYSDKTEFLHQQYQDWQQALTSMRERQLALEKQAREQKIAEEEQKQLEIQQKKQIEQEKKAQWQTPVDINMANFVRQDLDGFDQLLLHSRICDALTEIKRLAGNKHYYAWVLQQLMLQEQQIPGAYSAELKNAILKFREDFLINGGTLDQLFAIKDSHHPTFSTVYNYVLDVVFMELQTYNSVYDGLSSSAYKKPCSQSVANVRLGVPRVDVLLPEADEDVNLAVVLQLQEVGLYGAENLDGQPNRPNAYRAGSRERGSQLGRGLGQNDEEIARRMQTEEYCNQPQLNYSRRHSPLLFGPDAGSRQPPPPNPLQLRNSLALILGAALATYAIYTAVTSSFSWLALCVVIGIAVVTAVSLQRNRPLEAGNSPLRFEF